MLRVPRASVEGRSGPALGPVLTLASLGVAPFEVPVGTNVLDLEVVAEVVRDPCMASAARGWGWRRGMGVGCGCAWMALCDAHAAEGDGEGGV